MRPHLFLLTFFLAATPLSAITLVVDDVKGDDRNSGEPSAPLATIAQAVARAKPGDRIVLAPGEEPIHQNLVIPSRSGEPGKPIIFDGGGRTLIGTRPLDPADWEQVRPGVYRSTKYLAKGLSGPRPNSVVARCFMVFNGKMQRMGLTDKLQRPPLPAPEALKPGEWTVSLEEKAFYLATDPEVPLAEAGIELPQIQNGVALHGDTAYWEIRNLKVHRFINDGFNFHGKNHDILLEDIAATECSDDGMSAHGECRITVHRFTAEGNATGICHINDSISENSEVILRNNIGPNLYLLDSGSHSFTDSRVSALGKGVRLGRASGKKTPKPVTVRFVRTVIEDRNAPGARYAVHDGVRLELEESPSAEVNATP